MSKANIDQCKGGQLREDNPTINKTVPTDSKRAARNGGLHFSKVV
jgi:hypothetical protein